MKQAIIVIQIISALILIVSVLMQQRGAGLGGVFGGDSGVYRTKRGIEKGLLYISIIAAVLFFATLVTLFLVR